EAAQPRFAWRVFNEPGARRGDQQQSTGVESLVDRGQESGRFVKAVHQVGGQDEIVTGELRFQVAGVALEEGTLAAVPARSRSASDTSRGSTSSPSSTSA